MKTVILAAAAVALVTTQAVADAGYAPKGGAPRQATRRTAVSQVRSGGSGGAGSTGGATRWGTPPAENGAVNGTWQEQVHAYHAGRTAGYPGGGAGGAGRGLVGGAGLGSYGRSLGSSRRLNEHGLPDVLVPGQLYRSAGLGYKISEPETPPSLLAVNSGDRIKYEDQPNRLEQSGAGVHQGPRDTPPPPNPVSGGSTIGANTGITENRGNNSTINIDQRGRNTINQ